LEDDDVKSIWVNLPLAGGRQEITRESNPVAWAYAHGSDLGGNLDEARFEAWELELSEIDRRRVDWHFDVPKTHWRQRDGTSIAIRKMTDAHLGHALRFAQTRKKHASRRAALTAEIQRRAVPIIS
jgi:hypothetical protein